MIHPSTSQPWVGLTFDDGPDPVFTPRVLEVLERFGQHATFFVVASNVAAWPHLVEQALDLGHEVANHSGGHEHLDRLPDAAVWASLDLGREAVRRVGSSSSLLRPPWGRTTEAVTSWARRHDASQVFWTRTLDGAIPIVGDRAGAAVAGLLNPGEIVLAHDGSRVLGSPMRQRDRSRSVAQLQPLLETLEASGLMSVTVSRLANLGPHDGHNDPGPPMMGTTSRRARQTGTT